MTFVPDSKGLISSSPSASAQAQVCIGHVQLRDLVVCPKSRGVVWYVGENSIIEHDVASKNAVPHYLARQLSFTPVTLAALPLPSTSNEDLVLLAAGGQDAELFLGLYSYMSTAYLVQNPSSSSANDLSGGKASEKQWSWEDGTNGSINNSVLLYIPPVDETTQHYPGNAKGRRHVHPRLVVSNNDCTVKFFNVDTSNIGFANHRSPPETRLRRRRVDGIERLERIGVLKLDVPVNHTSISPDKTTVLSCGDSPSIFLHRIRVELSGLLSFEHLATYTLPSPISPLSVLPIEPSPSPYLPYAFVNGSWTLTSHGGGPTSSCFSTAWNTDGSKFAVASQEGTVAVWDVRSIKPLAVWETGKETCKEKKPNNRGSTSTSLQQAPWRNGSNSLSSRPTTFGWDRPSEHSAIANGPYHGDMIWSDLNAAPSWGIRTLKFKKNASGREILVFTQHASFFHVIDAERFERHELVRIPQARLSNSSGQPVLLQSSRHSMPVDAEYIREPSRPSRGSPHRPSLNLSLGREATLNSDPRLTVRRRHEVLFDDTEYEQERLRAISALASLSPDPDFITSMLERLERARESNQGSVEPRGTRQTTAFATGSENGLERATYQSGPTTTVSGPGILPSRPSSTRRLTSSMTIPRQQRRPVSTRSIHQSATAPESLDEGDAMDDDRDWGERVVPSLPGEALPTRSTRGVVVIPPFRNRWSAEEARRILARYGIASVIESVRGDEARFYNSQTDEVVYRRSSSGRLHEQPNGTSTPTTENDDTGDTDVDFDCTPPRVVSPSPDEVTSSTDRPMTESLTLPAIPATSPLRSPPPSSFALPVPVTRSPESMELRLPPCRDLIENTARLDIAGVTFDQTGAYMYVATTEGVTEWKVEGTDTIWWSCGSWC